jgi:POT family proton-dependent oligopeptide transporter
MAAAVHIGNNGAEKSIGWWLVANYGVITIRKLFLSRWDYQCIKIIAQKYYRINDGRWF